MNTDSEQIREDFRRLGIKSTTPRLIIYQALMKFNHHPGAEELYKQVVKKHPGISLATVYKTLDMLVENKLAKKVVSAEDMVRYDARTDHHIHLYCEKTNKIFDHEDPGLQTLIGNYFRRKKIPNFKIREIQVNINGEKTR